MLTIVKIDPTKVWPYIRDGMAIPLVKSTYSLDVATVQSLDRMARAWGVSKSEALRRAIRAASTSEASARLTPLAALDALQKSIQLTPRAAGAWAGEVRRERRASGGRVGRKPA